MQVKDKSRRGVITVKLDNQYLVFTRNDIEIYDVPLWKYTEVLPLLRQKSWFTADIERQCNELAAEVVNG